MDSSPRAMSATLSMNSILTGQGFGGKFLCRFAGQHGVGASPCPEGAVFGDGEAGVVAGREFDDEAPFKRGKVGLVRVGLSLC